MNKRAFLKGVGLAMASRWLAADKASAAEADLAASASWSINMTVLESCSCPVFCPCFFDSPVPETSSTRQGRLVKEHACRVNQTYVVNSGHAGSVRLDGARLWYAANAGDFDQNKYLWAVLTFDPEVSKAQRDALLTILRMHNWYRPERWKANTVGEDAPVALSIGSKGVQASLGGGSIAETRTSTMFGLQGKPVKLSNINYFGFARNNGFVVMPSEVVAYRKGSDAFEYKHTSGLLTTVDMNSGDVKA
ncbi:MAG TPA: DUF1326 domain-containing protein [Terracidiphilus sp.]|nr:DUF1326 domain-containing protein [Terracidiphilus sp.]